MRNDKFCVRPFMHGLVDTEGKFKPCCRSTIDTGYNINDHTAAEWWESDYLDNLRQRMLRGESSAECQRCYRQEEQGFKSFREQSNEQWPMITSKVDTPWDWEIQITNLCNLKCMMCNPQSSSQVLIEDNILFSANWDQRRYNWNPGAESKIREMFKTGKSFVVRGGEPFMIPWIKQMIDEIPDRKQFLFNTNATCFDHEWVNILSRHDVKMSLSIDAFGELNHYIRFPSKWKDIIQNITMMREIQGVDIFLNTCVQNLNVLYLGDLLTWATKTQGLYVNLDVLTLPKWFEPSCLPVGLANLARQRLITVRDHIDNNMVRGLDSVINLLATPDQQHWPQFIKYVQAKDLHRSESVIDYIPEMEEYFV